MKPSKKLLLYVMTGAIIGLFAFVSGELLLRIYHAVNPVFVFTDTSYNRFRGKPYADDYDFQLNSKGFKDVEFAKAKEPGVYRIVGIGDSFVFGVVPYRDNFLTVLEEILQTPSRAVEVINMGIPGTSPSDYLSMLVNEGVELNPDLVVLCLFIGNDFEAKASPRFKSYLVSFFRFLMAARQHWQGSVIHGKADYQDRQPTFSEEKYLEIEKVRSAIFKKHNDAFRRSLKTTLAYLTQIRDICLHRNSSLLIVLIPDELQINGDLQRQVIASQASLAEEWDFTLPNTLLSQELRRLGIDHADLLDVFLRRSATTDLYKPRDSHWNIAGNHIAAEAIAEHLSADPAKTLSRL